MQEQWVDVMGFDGKYQVSNTGKVRSTNYNNTHTTRELKQKLNKYGYYEVKLSMNNITKDFMVGRLVAMHFIPNPMFKPKVVHIKDTKDNSVENLMWAYESEAMHHYYNKRARKGQPSYTKITYNDKDYIEYKDIARDLGLKDKTFYKRINKLGWDLYSSLEIPTGKWSWENKGE